jgi:hypothetical protein
MQTLPFPGQAPSFNVIVVNNVPLPAAIWLMVSGLASLCWSNRTLSKLYIKRVVYFMLPGEYCLGTGQVKKLLYKNIVL